MSYSHEDFIRDINKEFSNARNRTTQKQKMRELMTKYGNTKKDIENNSSINEWMAYQLAGGDEMLYLIQQEEKLNDEILNPYSSPDNLLTSSSISNNIEEEEEEEELSISNTNKITQKHNKLLNRSMERLKRPLMEGYKDYIYIDSEGYISTGVGANIDNKADFMKLDWRIGDRLATNIEKETAYNDFVKLKHLKNYKAETFKKQSNLRLSEETINSLLENHLRKDLRALREGIDGFDDFPLELQEVLLDIRFNTGNLARSNWPKLRKALDEKNLTEILNNIHRKKISDERNKWAEDKIKSIKKL